MKLRKLTDSELRRVNELAEALREQDKDKYKLGHAFLYLFERNKILEDIAVKADYFLRFGQGTKELTSLRMAIEHLREMDEDVNEDSSMFV
ncbi:MAG: hypothetical protein ACWA5Q_04020 [bacterium]